MNTLQLAARNLVRNRRRTLTTLLAMIVGVVAVLIFGGYDRNIRLGLETDFVRGSGHLQIQHRDYFLFGSGNPAAYGIRDYTRLMQTLQADPQLAPLLQVVTPVLDLGGIAGNFAAGVSRTVYGRGVDVVGQNQLKQWNDYRMVGLPQRSVALTGTAPNAAVVGTGVARVLQLCTPLQVKDCPQPLAANEQGRAMPADLAALPVAAPAANLGRVQIELLAARASGAPNVASLQVVKAEQQGVKALDDISVQLHLTQAQQLVYGQDTPQVSAIVLQLRHSSDMPAARARLAQLLQGGSQPLVVQDFATLNPQYGQITGMFAAILGFVAVLIGAIVLFTVGNTMSMAVVERTVEIGTLRALGLRQAGIRRLFVSEGLLLGLGGALLGSLLALGLAWLINHSGLTWLPPGNSERIPLLVRVAGEYGMLLATAVGLIVLSVLSAWWPARRAARLDIVEALRHA
ncbi:FtsX-like permease family protein [Vogesella sp. DC21W]|uniref:FtsX-like permease family protein n=1 Tax=Vogesella aquatica TaxID=2984206 RepID=A0ABT5J302_9NEIS|nr:FtsX-like permease family protein [Vogesella aquatica]MDC7719057.1 FtsX-like permease family protein [Vogesella aquatica]